MHISGASQSIQLSSCGPQRGMCWASNQYAVNKADIPYKVPAMQAQFIPRLEIPTATSERHRHPHTQACMLCVEWQLSSSLCSWMGLWSGDLAEKRELNHFHISAGLKSIMKMTTCGCHIFSRLNVCAVFFLLGTFSGMKTNFAETSIPYGNQTLILMQQKIISEVLVELRAGIKLSIMNGSPKI